MALALAAITMRIKHLTVWPVVDDDGYLLGIVTADHVNDLVRAAEV
jgi:Mg/Co/Ni transporter MgtE